MFLRLGGEGGIRTLGSLLGYGALAKRCFRPLSHLTKKTYPQPCEPLRNAPRARVENIAKNRAFPTCNLGSPTPIRRVLAISSELPIVDCQLIRFDVDVEAGEFVRRRGCDLAEGQMILSEGERICAATVALLASQGFADVIVGGKATAAVISTGDELVKPGEELQPGQIYDSNSALLRALLQRCGANMTAVEHCYDDRQSLGDAIRRGIKNHVLIISGGVSVGEHDLVKEALSELGAKIEIWRVAVKPGKPFLFGRIEQDTPSPKSSQRSAPSRAHARTRSAGEGSVSGSEG